PADRDGGEEDRRGHSRRPGIEDREGAEAGGDALAAPEAQRDRVAVSGDSSERGARGPPRVPRDERAGEEDGERALAGVERERRAADPPAAGPGDVRGPDVAAPDRADVAASREPEEDQPEGDASDQVRGREREGARHLTTAAPSGNRARLVY